MRDEYAYRFNLPSSSALEDIRPYIPLLLAAIDDYLSDPELWLESEYDDAKALLEDLRAYVAEMPANTPLGAILAYGGSTPPDGWLLCDGSLVSTEEYPALFMVLGYTYGGSAGQFALPNLSRRSPIGVGGNWSIGQQVGAETHTLTIDQLPAHDHIQRGNTLATMFHGASGGSASRATLQQTTITAFSSSYLTTAQTGSGQAHNNVGPSLALNFIVRAR